jgi:hypothetical protein
LAAFFLPPFFFVAFLAFFAIAIHLTDLDSTARVHHPCQLRTTSRVIKNRRRLTRYIAHRKCFITSSRNLQHIFYRLVWQVGSQPRRNSCRPAAQKTSTFLKASVHAGFKHVVATCYRRRTKPARQSELTPDDKKFCRKGVAIGFRAACRPVVALQNAHSRRAVAAGSGYRPRGSSYRRLLFRPGILATAAADACTNRHRSRRKRWASELALVQAIAGNIATHSIGPLIERPRKRTWRCVANSPNQACRAGRRAIRGTHRGWEAGSRAANRFAFGSETR